MLATFITFRPLVPVMVVGLLIVPNVWVGVSPDAAEEALCALESAFAVNVVETGTSVIGFWRLPLILTVLSSCKTPPLLIPPLFPPDKLAVSLWPKRTLPATGPLFQPSVVGPKSMNA